MLPLLTVSYTCLQHRHVLERDVTKTRVRTSRYKIRVSKRAPHRKSLDFVASFLRSNSVCFSIVLEYSRSKTSLGK